MKKRVFLLFLSSIVFNSCSVERANPIETSCDNGTYEGIIVLNTQEELDAFGAMCYTEIDGFLTIGSDPSLSDINDLNPLNSLIRVGVLEISNNSELTNLDGLERLTSVNEIRIVENDNLENIDDLTSLEVANKISLYSNPNLSSLKGFQNIEHLDLLSISWFHDFLNFEDFTSLNTLKELSLVNSNILDLSGLESVLITETISIIGSSLTSLNGIHTDGNLKGVLLTWAPGITDLNVFSNVVNIEGSIGISSSSLTSLAGLENLRSATRMTLRSNDNLTSLDGLENLNYSEVIEIGLINAWGNDSLTDFCALQNLFTNGTYQEVIIDYNAFNPTAEDIIVGDCSL